MFLFFLQSIIIEQFNYVHYWHFHHLIFRVNCFAHTKISSAISAYISSSVLLKEQLLRMTRFLQSCKLLSSLLKMLSQQYWKSCVWWLSLKCGKIQNFLVGFWLCYGNTKPWVYRVFRYLVPPSTAQTKSRTI